MTNAPDGFKSAKGSPKTAEPIGPVNAPAHVNERMHAEDYAQRLALIVESSDDAIISKDLNGVVTT